ncbi:MAG TPA: hypothetical protein ENI79_01235 [Rhodospirillales bacterium]|nr:hypothetical protein [Rhodospirillales bacterium]
MADTYPIQLYQADAVILSLNGTIDAATGVELVDKGVNASSSPTLQVRLHRVFYRLAELLGVHNQGRVVETGALAVGVFPIDYRLANTEKHYAGSTAQVVIDNDTNYVYVDSSNALVINVTGFPVDPTTYLPLAEVVAVNGVLTFTDRRHWVAWTVAQPAGTYATAALDNLASVDINASLLVDTDNTYDLGSAAKAWRIAYIASQIICKKAGGNVTIDFTDPAAPFTLTVPDAGGADSFALVALAQTLLNKTLTWEDPAAARALNIPDPGADAAIVMDVATQTLTNKTLTTPTIGDLTNAPHDHADAAGGGLLSETAFGSGKYFPVSPCPHYESGSLTVKVLDAEYVAPFAFTLRSVLGRVNTAPTGDALIVDTRINGASIHAAQVDMVNIAAGANQDESATEDVAVAKGDVITFEVEQIGSATAGADLTMVLNGLAAADTV